MKEFYLLPVSGKLMQYDSIAVNTIVANREGKVSSCDIPFTDDLAASNVTTCNSPHKLPRVVPTMI